jgi:hypothetical protein
LAICGNVAGSKTYEEFAGSLRRAVSGIEQRSASGHARDARKPLSGLAFAAFRDAP